MRHQPAILRLAETTLGIITRAELLHAGLSPSAIERARRAGVIEDAHPGVYRCAGALRSHAQSLLAAQRAAGSSSVISHRAAAQLWGITEQFPHNLELTVPAPRSPRLHGVAVHRGSDLARSDIRTRDHLLITSVERTLADLGGVTSARTVATAVERAVIERLTTIARLYCTVDRLARCGRPGIGDLRTALDGWLLGDKPPDSVLEPMMARLVRRYGLPAPELQHVVRAGGRFVAKVDFVWPAAALVGEVDGFHAHGTAAALQRDLRRQNDLVALGYRILRFTWTDVVRAHADVAARIGAALAVTSAA